jgi:soluble lytic murein transglycosylase-like protein
MRRTAVFAFVSATALSVGAAGQVWNRTARDGTVEFTNRRPAGAGWHGADSGERAAAGGGTFWSRERADGVVEFTNQAPPGARWKVWLKAGPGKAAALRGRTDLVPPRDGSATRFSRYDQHIHDQQAFFGIPEALMRAVIKTESDFDPNVVSSVGAKGLMQLMPDTARLMGVTDVFDPRQNVMGGARYLQVLARRFCKTVSATETSGSSPRLVCSPEEKVKIIAGYHAGPGAVEKYGGIPPYETTRAYVTMVMRRYDQYRQAAGDAEVIAEGER